MGTKGEKTKKSILETAALLFWEHSYNLVKVDQIVEKAKVNKATFYRYFKSKEEVGLAAIDFIYETNRNLINNKEVKAILNPIKRLEFIINLTYETQKSIFDKEHKIFGCPYVNMSTEMANENELMRQKILEIFLEFEKYYQTICEEAIKQGLATTKLDSIFLGKQLFGLLNSAAVRAKLRKRPEEFLESLIAMKILIGAK